MRRTRTFLRTVVVAVAAATTTWIAPPASAAAPTATPRTGRAWNAALAVGASAAFGFAGSGTL